MSRMNRFKVWVEIEEVDKLGDHVADHSDALDGAAIAEFDNLDEAIDFGNRLQLSAERREI